MSLVCLLSFVSLSRQSLVSVVFDFNASLNAVAPMYSILLTVDMKRREKG